MSTIGPVSGLFRTCCFAVDQAARVAVATRELARAVPGDLLDPREGAAVSRDQRREPVLARSPALARPAHVELADQVAEDDRAVAGHQVSISSA